MPSLSDRVPRSVILRFVGSLTRRVLPEANHVAVGIAEVREPAVAHHIGLRDQDLSASVLDRRQRPLEIVRPDVRDDAVRCRWLKPGYLGETAQPTLDPVLAGFHHCVVDPGQVLQLPAEDRAVEPLCALVVRVQELDVTPVTGSNRPVSHFLPPEVAALPPTRAATTHRPHVSPILVPKR